MTAKHAIKDYKDKDGKWRWNITVTPGTPAGTEPDIVADSGQGYNNKQDMLNSLFGIFFTDYDESFMRLFEEWQGGVNLSGQEVSSDKVVEQQP